MREPAGQDVVLVAHETGDAKSSTDCVGAGRPYSGAIKRIGLCQVAVCPTAVTASVRVVIDRVQMINKVLPHQSTRMHTAHGTKGSAGHHQHYSFRDRRNLILP